MSDTPNDPSNPDAEADGVADVSADVETEPEAYEAAAAPPPAARPARGGRGLAILALLLAVVAFGASAWPWWLAWQGEDDMGRLRAALDARVDARVRDLQQELRDRQQEQLAGQQEQLERLEERLDGRVADIAAAAESVRRHLEQSDREVSALRDEFEERAGTLRDRERELESTVAGLRRAFSELAGEVAKAAPPDSREWRIAEAGYLLRIANQRARLERDLRGAHALLVAADGVLAEIEDFSLVPVREALVEAKADLAAEPAVDRIALYLELESIALSIDAMPLQPPEFRPPPAVTQAAREDGWWPAVEHRLLALFDFRRHRDDPVRPLLTPDASFWWHHNVRLKLSQAQLALLRGDQEVWEASLLDAANWVREQPGYDAVSSNLEALSERAVRVTAPDISEPLRRLERLRSRVPTELNP
ncbi:MAG: hypothetical protein EA417_18850 [Gammaproteobacteria bacterium]|nr:MAG: hypothetical protein EA417_18850 [Gammaproteobacteria bacterium]